MQMLYKNRNTLLKRLVVGQKVNSDGASVLREDFHLISKRNDNLLADII